MTPVLGWGHLPWRSTTHLAGRLHALIFLLIWKGEGGFGHCRVCGAGGPAVVLGLGGADSPRSVMVPPLTGADSESFLVLTAAEGSDAEHPKDGPPHSPRS